MMQSNRKLECQSKSESRHMFRMAGLVLVWALGSTANAQTTAPATADLSLYIVQSCASPSKRGRCGLSFVQTPSGVMPSGDITRTCAPGWLAHVTAERGTVEKGGVNRGQAVVCGYSEPAQALRALFIACDQQTFGTCQDANYADVQWAFWSGDDAALKQLPIDTPLKIEQLPQAQRCESVVPLVESARCSPEAAVLLRQNGLR